MPTALDEFEEHRPDRARVEVHELAVGTAVVQQVEFAEFGHRRGIDAEPARDVVVVVVRYRQKRKAPFAGGPRQPDDVGARERDVLGHGGSVEHVRCHVQRQPNRPVRRPHDLAAHEAGGARDLGRRIRREPEDAGQEQHRFVGGLPGLEQVDVIDDVHRRLTRGQSVLELADPRRRQSVRRRGDPVDLGAVGRDCAVEFLFCGVGATVGRRSLEVRRAA